MRRFSLPWSKPGAPAFRQPSRTLGLLIGPVAALAVWLAPMPALERDARLLAAVLALVFVYWVTEALPLADTALSPALSWPSSSA